jgi:hypothetical protein
VRGATFAGAVVSVGNVILLGDVLKGDRGLSESMSRKGLRDTGRAGASRGDARPDDTFGDAARLRKGLFDDRLRGSRPGTGRDSTKQDC